MPVPVNGAGIPKEMKAVVWYGVDKPMGIETLVTPTPRKGEMLVKTRACGVCHTDLHVIKGEVPFPAPAVLGHEISGTVVAVGPDVKKANLMGQKVVCPFIMPCMDCQYCGKGAEDQCEKFFALNRLKGALYDGETRLFRKDGTPLAMYSMGGLAEYCVVPESAVYPLVGCDHLWAEAAIVGCMFFTANGAVTNAKLQKGESCAVFGCGGVGSGVLQMAKRKGASPIIAIDVGDEKLEAAKKMGATHAINGATCKDVPAAIAEITNGTKVDVGFEVIGLKQTFENCVMGLKDGGRMVAVGIADVKVKAEVPITHIVRRSMNVRGSYGGIASKDTPELLDALKAGDLDVKTPITRRFTIEEAPEAYKLLNEKKIIGRAIVEFPQ